MFRSLFSFDLGETSASTLDRSCWIALCFYPRSGCKAKQLLISPDGELNLIPFEALVDQQGRYLIERHSFSYLTSGRDLIRLQLARASKSAPFVMANPMFGDQEIALATRSAGMSRTALGRHQV
jgi:CHAT domain-containing protein